MVNMEGLPEEFRAISQPAAPAPQHTCCVTGLPARYRDPASGLPYATAEAFRVRLACLAWVSPDPGVSEP